MRCSGCGARIYPSKGSTTGKCKSCWGKGLHAFMPREQRVEAGRKLAASLTPEDRARTGHITAVRMTPQERHQRAIKGVLAKKERQMPNKKSPPRPNNPVPSPGSRWLNKAVNYVMVVKKTYEDPHRDDVRIEYVREDNGARRGIWYSMFKHGSYYEPAPSVAAAAPAPVAQTASGAPDNDRKALLNLLGRICAAVERLVRESEPATPARPDKP